MEQKALEDLHKGHIEDLQLVIRDLEKKLVLN
jgi:hypothetical protein